VSTARAAEALVSHRSPLDASEVTSRLLGSSAFTREAKHFEVVLPSRSCAVRAVCACASPCAAKSHVLLELRVRLECSCSLNRARRPRANSE
jgi:hypothetical protein